MLIGWLMEQAVFLVENYIFMINLTFFPVFSLFRHPIVPRAGLQVEPHDHPERGWVRGVPWRREPGHPREGPRRHRPLRLPALPPPIQGPKVPGNTNGRKHSIAYMTAGWGFRGGSISNFDPKPYKMHCIFMPLSSKSLGVSTFWRVFRGGGVPGILPPPPSRMLDRDFT